VNLSQRHRGQLRLPANAKHTMRRAEITEESLLSIPEESWEKQRTCEFSSISPNNGGINGAMPFKQIRETGPKEILYLDEKYKPRQAEEVVS